MKVLHENSDYRYHTVVVHACIFFYISYEFRIFGMQEHLPMVHGDSMLHARNVDPKTGEFYDIGFGVRYTDGYGYLPPNAVSLYITI